MTALERRVNMAAVFIPFAVTAVAVVLLWGGDWLGWSDVAVFVLMYLVSGLGVTVGFHRMLTHRAFQTHAFTRYAFAYMGMLSVQGPVIDWVADHRKHHAHTDTEGDPHSPHVGEDGSAMGTLKGLWHAHTAWLWRTHGQARARKYAKDLVEDRGMRILNRKFPLIVGASLAIPTFGESWHHNHHAFPRSAMHGLRWWEVDIGGLVIRAMRRLGLAWNVVLISPERQEQRKVEAAPKLRPTPPPRSAALERGAQ